MCLMKNTYFSSYGRLRVMEARMSCPYLRYPSTPRDAKIDTIMNMPILNSPNKPVNSFGFSMLYSSARTCTEIVLSLG